MKWPVRDADEPSTVAAVACGTDPPLSMSGPVNALPAPDEPS